MNKFKSRRRSGTGLKRSPAKGRSPFKKRSVSKLASNENAEDIPENSTVTPAPANIRVAVRVRPENEREINSNNRNVIEVVGDSMLVFDPKEDNPDFFFHGQKQQRRDLNKKANRDQKFAFDVVFGPESNNEDVYAGTTKELVDVVFEGYNCSVFVYGATGAGKTHTMLGSLDNPGIIFRTVMELYKRIEALQEESDCEVVISYLEIYNETVIDLINPGSQLHIREDGKMGVNIPGLSRHRPSGPDDLLRLLQYGNGNRTQHPTDANKESSRSHAVFQVYIKQTGKGSGLSADVKVAKLSMIDLAGSERGSATSSRGAARFREGANINKSLLALGNCINALADGSKYIPYRNSKLTRLLKDSIGGNCRTVMISNVSPSSLTYEDTYNTLRYADRAKKIKIKLKKNVCSVDFQVGQYQKIVEDLKSQLNECKVKIAALEDENSALKNQVEMDDKERSSVKSFTQNNEELEMLKSQLSELQDRQSNYDELQTRITEFEARERLAEIEKNTSAKIETEEDEKRDKYLQSLKESFYYETLIRQLKIKKQNHQNALNRVALLNPDSEFDPEDTKLYRIMRDLDKKMLKLKKKKNQLFDDESEGAENYSEFDDKVKQNAQLEHSLKLVEIMFHEQAKTEELLHEALTQLKNLYLTSYGSTNNEVKDNFKELLEKMQCSTIQFRDHNITETNQDSVFDKMGTFYGNLLNLDHEEVSNLNETVVMDSKFNETIMDQKSELIVTIEPNLNETEDVIDEDVDESPVRWRPPTPPKATPPKNTGQPKESSEETSVTSGISAPLFSALVEGSENTPSPPMLTSLESRKLFKPIQETLDETFDLNNEANKTFDVQNNANDTVTKDEDLEELSPNATVVIEKTENENESEIKSDFNATVVIEPCTADLNSTVVLETKTEISNLNATVVLEKENMEPLEEIVTTTRKATFSTTPQMSRAKVAKVSPMVPETTKYHGSAHSAPQVDRRAPPPQRKQGGVLRRQPGIKSTSNLLRTVLDRPAGLSAEAPEARTPGQDVPLPSYLRPTTASSKKFGGKSTESENVGHQRGFRTTGAVPKQSQRMRKDPPSNTLKPINK